jgi:F-type H+-transporting ATPase subunit b
MENQSTEASPPGEHGGNFPPFRQETFPSQLLWLAIFFVALYVLAARLALPRVGSILEARRARISGDFAAAARMKEEADAAAAGYEQALAQARAQAQAVTAATHQKLKADADVKRKAVENELHVRLAEAERVIAAKKTAAMANLRGIAEEAAAAIVTRLTGTTPPQTLVAKAVSAAVKP